MNVSLNWCRSKRPDLILEKCTLQGWLCSVTYQVSSFHCYARQPQCCCDGVTRLLAETDKAAGGQQTVSLLVPKSQQALWAAGGRHRVWGVTCD